MNKPKHTPIRTCVACRTCDAKGGLLRVVRQADGSILYDAKGKMPGRGAYVCAQRTCIALARKQKKFERSLKISVIQAGLFQELELHARDASVDGAPAIAALVSQLRDRAEAPTTELRSQSTDAVEPLVARPATN